MSPNTILVAFCALALAGCTALPGQGPSTAALSQNAPATSGFEVVDVSPQVLQVLQSSDSPALSFGDSSGAAVPGIGVGDVVRVSIWEAGAGGLFSSAAAPGAPSAGSQAASIPEQEVGSDGAISVPYIGRVRVAGLSQSAAEGRIQSALEGRAIQPQVVLTVSQQVGSSVTLAGEVSGAGRIPLSQSGDRILDVLASSGGPRVPVQAAMINLSRGGYTVSVPMRTIVDDPHENIFLAPGDVLTITSEPEVFFAFGATGRNSEIEFGGDTITVQQAIARSGGLLDSRADPSGVFLLRLEQPSVVQGFAPNSPLLQRGSLVPVAYRFDMRDPYSLFLASSMQMRHHDTLYVTNSFLSDLSKVTRLFGTVAAPVNTTTNLLN